MNISQIQKLLDERNLDSQQMSEQTGLPVKSIESFEKRTRTVFAELEEISKALDMPPSEMLGIFLVEGDSSSGVSELYCRLFPQSSHCQKNQNAHPISF